MLIAVKAILRQALIDIVSRLKQVTDPANLKAVFIDSQPETQAQTAPVDWRFIAPVLMMGFILRVIVGLNNQGIHQADEIFQYLEQGHRLAFGYGYVPWEYVYGIRSWLIPGILAGIMSLCAFFGADTPAQYDAVIRILLSALSLTLPYAMYHIGRTLSGEFAGKAALLIGCFWYEFIFWAPRPMADILTTYALIGAIAVLLARPTRGRIIMFGVLLSLAVAIRFQVLPAAGILAVFALTWWRTQAIWAIITGLVMIGLYGALDKYMWGVWFSSITENVRMNLVEDIASTFGVQSWHFLLNRLVLTSFGLVIIGQIALLLKGNRSLVLLLALWIGVFLFSLSSHKEVRFVLFCVPIYLLGVSLLIDYIVSYMKTKGLRPIRAPQLGAALLALGFIGCNLYYWVPTPRKAYPVPLISRPAIREIYRDLSMRDNVSGIIDDGERWYQTGGFYDLHKDVPIYVRNDLTGNEAIYTIATSSPHDYVSHWITQSDAPPAPGFRLATQRDGIYLWESLTPPVRPRIINGYTRTLKLLYTSQPQVKPRI